MDAQGTRHPNGHFDLHVIRLEKPSVCGDIVDGFDPTDDQATNG